MTSLKQKRIDLMDANTFSMLSVSLQQKRLVNETLVSETKVYGLARSVFTCSALVGTHAHTTIAVKMCRMCIDCSLYVRHGEWNFDDSRSCMLETK
mmetsp:Transcript_17480/g.38521  ORF Transcript_17480/g.38521 Transcript_17480/m.38521 type:complete len:96 (-) Transcript_17480:21-308(-)